MEDLDLISFYKESEDKDAFTVLYERYGHLVMGTCMKYLKDEFDAEDMTSKIFEELGQKILRHTIMNFKGWLYRLTKNECLMFLRKQKSGFIYKVSIDALSEDNKEPENTEQQLVLMEQSLSSLKSDQEKCIRLFYLEDKSYQEVADLLQLEIKKVKSAIQNGKRNLKLILVQNDEFNQ